MHMPQVARGRLDNQLADNRHEGALQKVLALELDKKRAVN